MLRAIVTRLFFTFSSAYMFTSVLSMVGIVLVVTLKKHEEEHKFVILVLVSILLMALSYFVTVPLFKIHFVPDRIMGVFAVVPIMFSLFALSVLIKIPAAKYKGHANYLRVQLLALLLVFAYCHVQAVNAYKGGEWYKVGLGSLDDGKMQMQNCILGNADVNDVILTTKEIGFAVNALTGRKLVVARRSANDAFENMDIREMDAAVILYGNNIALKKELIKKYSIKYLYWEYYWVASEFQIDPQGQVVGLSDPLMSFYDVGMAKYLEENGVRYMVRNTYIDPFLRTTSLRSRYHPKFDLIIVSADNYTDVTHPWNPNLDPLLTEIWSYEPGSRKLAALYAVN